MVVPPPSMTSGGLPSCNRHWGVLLSLSKHKLMHQSVVQLSNWRAWRHLGWQIALGEACVLGAAALMLMRLCGAWRPTGNGSGQLGMGRAYQVVPQQR
jgi:hypothetical protein